MHHAPTNYGVSVLILGGSIYESIVSMLVTLQFLAKTHGVFVCVAELHFSTYCVYVVRFGCCIHRAFNMEVNQGLDTCEYYFCWDAHHKHVQVNKHESP